MDTMPHIDLQVKAVCRRFACIMMSDGRKKHDYNITYQFDDKKNSLI